MSDVHRDRSSEAIMVRTGSLQLSSTSIGTSSLKRTKRKAPAPPSKTPLAQTDERNSAMAHGLPLEDGIAPDSMLELSSPEGMSTPEGSLGPGFLSQEQCAVPKPPDEISEGPGTPEAAVASLTCRCSGWNWLGLCISHRV